MADVQVTCINKQPRRIPITHLGGTNWRWTRAQVIDSISAKTNTFFTLVTGRRANVGCGTARDPDVRTYADNVWTNNLLALPECGA